VVRRDHQEYVTALATTLDLASGLANTWHVRSQRDYVTGLAARIDLDAGLAAALDRLKPAARSLNGPLLRPTGVQEASHQATPPDRRST